MPSGLPLRTIRPISRVTKLITQCSSGDSTPRHRATLRARRAPWGRCTPASSHSPRARDEGELALPT